MNNKVLVDLDGTLARYDGWKGHTHIGEPIMPMVERIKQHLKDGFTVEVFTARMSDPDPKIRLEISQAVGKWTMQQFGVALKATCMKDYAMAVLYDDRAVGVVFNRGITHEEQRDRYREALVKVYEMTTESVSLKRFIESVLNG